MKQCNKMKMVFVMCASAFVIQSVMASDEEVKIPTLQLVKQVWSVNYQYPGEKFFAVEWLFNALAKYPDAQDEADMAAAQEYLLSEVLKTPVATVHEEDGRISAQVHWMGDYLRKISHWPTMRYATNRLMRIADKVAQYHTFFDLSKTDALVMAHQVDNYVEYGTNRPPVRGGTISGFSTYKPWFGPSGSHVARVIDFRRSYNKNVVELRRNVLSNFHFCITQRDRKEPRSSDPETERALWLEFARRIGATSEEVAAAEGK